MKIQILIDNHKSWSVRYAQVYAQELRRKGHEVSLVHSQKRLKRGDLLILLSCEKILTQEQLDLHRHNLIVHESALPNGKGWSPLTWQVLEGKRKIRVTLFEAALRVDSGPIYGQTDICLEGHELVDELREKQAKATLKLLRRFMRRYPKVRAKAQRGRETFYQRRKPEDSRFDVRKSLAEQFNLLRVADNEKYPAFFEFKGHRYLIQIRKEKTQR